MPCGRSDAADGRGIPRRATPPKARRCRESRYSQPSPGKRRHISYISYFCSYGASFSSAGSFTTNAENDTPAPQWGQTNTPGVVSGSCS